MRLPNNQMESAGDAFFSLQIAVRYRARKNVVGGAPPAKLARGPPATIPVWLRLGTIGIYFRHDLRVRDAKRVLANEADLQRI